MASIGHVAKWGLLHERLWNLMCFLYTSAQPPLSW
jgi:hypothetical protein